ncbi:MAG: hypothetical protein ABSF46_26700 [Terriglobia bacterium]|jgi:hypothetical protein
MEEISTAPVPWSTRAEVRERPPARPSRRQAENRRRVPSDEPETNEQDDAPEGGEPEHDLDISV